MKVTTNDLLFEAVLRDYKEDRRAIVLRKLPEMWMKYEEQYMNEYWKHIERADHLSEMTSNALFEVVESQLPVITARAPKPDVVLEPIMLSEGELEWARNYADNMQRELINIWSDDDENDMQQLVQSGFREHGVKGKFLLHSEYSLRKQKIVNEAVDIFSIVPDRTKPSIEACHDSHLCFVTYRTPEWIMDRFGVQVDAEGFFNDDGEFSFYGAELSPVAGAVSFAINAIKGMFTEDSADKNRGYCLLIKYYCSGKVLVDDPTKEKYSETQYEDDGAVKRDEKGDEMTLEEEREKYPTGRVITVVRNYKNKILLDHPNPYNRYPFFETTNFKRAGDFWGTSEGLNIETHTMATNLIISNVVDNARYTGNPQRLIVGGAEQEDMPVAPGTSVHTQLPEGVGYLQPPRLQNLSWFLDWLQGDTDRKTGITDAFRGMADAGDSGVKVQAQIAQGVGRLQPKTSEFLILARKLFKHWIFIIQNFYPEEVVQEIQDEETGEKAYEVFNPREGAYLQLKPVIGNTAMLPADNFGEFEEAKYLFEMGVKLFGFPLVSPEHLVDLAPSIGDQRRVKTWMKQKFAEAEQAAQQQMEAEQQADAGPQPTEEELMAIQNATAAGDQEAIKDILTGMKERYMAENAPLPPDGPQA